MTLIDLIGFVELMMIMVNDHLLVEVSHVKLVKSYGVKMYV